MLKHRFFNKLLGACAVRRATPAGDYRRRVDVIEELVFVIETDDFPAVVHGMQRYGGRTPLATSGQDYASFALSSGILLRLQLAARDNWGFHMVACTGSKLTSRN
jgi:DNA polymerase/3'-5' exonuclease PolX